MTTTVGGVTLSHLPLVETTSSYANKKLLQRGSAALKCRKGWGKIFYEKKAILYYTFCFSKINISEFEFTLKLNLKHYFKWCSNHCNKIFKSGYNTYLLSGTVPQQKLNLTLDVLSFRG